jgi:hypothetical protein
MALFGEDLVQKSRLSKDTIRKEGPFVKGKRFSGKTLNS